MPLIAGLTASEWAVVIGAVYLGLTQLFSMWLDYQREQRKLNRDAALAATANRVEQKADEAATAAVKADVKADATVEAVREVKTDLKNGLLEVATNTNQKVTDMKGQLPLEVIEKVAEEVRVATREQAVGALLNDPRFEALTLTIAEQAIRRFKEREGKG